MGEKKIHTRKFNLIEEKNKESESHRMQAAAAAAAAPYMVHRTKFRYEKARLGVVHVLCVISN